MQSLISAGRYSIFALRSLPFVRSLSTTNSLRLKEIVETRKNDTLILEGRYVDAPKQAMVVPQVSECKQMGETFCPRCTLGLDVKHTDVLILSQYVRSDGCMLPRRITGLCRKQQKYIGTLVRMAHKSGLMPNLSPSYSKKDPKKRFGWKKFNKYFDESTIKLR